MATNVSLKQVERRAWRSFFEDGLLDMYVGLMLMVLGARDLFTNLFGSGLPTFGAGLVLAVLAFLPYWAGKRFISVPRMGRAKFGAARKAKQTKAAFVYSVSVIAGVIILLMIMLGLSSSPPVWVQMLGARGFIALGVGGCMMLMFGLASYFTDYRRGYVIAVLYGLGFSGTTWLGNPMILLLAGGLIVLMGTVVFVRFLRKYPMPAQGAAVGDD